VGAVESTNPAGCSDLDHDVALLPARNIGVDPSHRGGIGIERGAQQRSLVDVVEIPIVPRQMLVVPFELPGLDIERQGRIGIEIGGRGLCGGPPPAPAVVAGGRLWSGDRPIKRLAFRIVRTRQPPAAGDAPLDRYVAPGIAARLAGSGGVVELPDFLAGCCVVRRYEAAGARLAGAAGDYLALDHERRRRVLGELLVVLDF